MSKKFRWLLVVLSGVLLGLAFPPFPFPWLAWIAFVPLLKALDDAGRREAAAMTIGTHLTAYLIVGHWVILHPDPYTRLASLAGLLWLVVLSSMPWIAGSLARPSAQRGLAVTAGIAAVDLFQLHTELGFPWLILGHAHAGFEPFNQLAELGGVTLLSIWIVLVNLLLFGLVQTRIRRQRLKYVAALTTLILAPAVFGLARMPGADDHYRNETTDTVELLGIQPGLSVGLWLDATDETRVDSLARITDRLHQLSTTTSASPLIVIWPETVIPPVDMSTASGIDILRALRPDGADALITGGVEIVSGSPGSPYRNTLFLIGDSDAPVARYHKRNLVPFAERVPYSDRFPILNRLAVPAGGVWGYSRGKTAGLFDIRHSRIRLGMLICFESVFGALSRRLAVEGADVLIVATQDGWWGDSFGYRQHLEFNRLRAIETRRPVFQVSATGLSAQIQPSGRVVKRVDWMKQGVLSASVQVQSAETPYMAFGDWPAAACAILGLFLILSIPFRSNRHQ